MRTLVALFDFASTDLAAEEQNYLDVHVSLARELPGLRSYITGNLIGSKNHPAPYIRGAALDFDNAEALRFAMRESPIAKPLTDDGVAHLANLRWIHLDSEVIVPFATKKPGASYMMMAAEFDLKLNGGDYAAAEQRYLDHHTHIARRLPGLRHYLVGRVVPKQGLQPERPRMALLFFDNAEAGRDAYRSAVGQELARDEEATIANPRVYRLDATMQA
jgi:uncharacterized protein (TIGR02118 family)